MQRRKAPPPRPARCHPGRKALAYHEAGHAVAGYLLGLEIEHLDIVPDETGLGHCVYRNGEEHEQAGGLDTDRLLLLLLAGPVAEEIAVRRPSAAADERKALRFSAAHSCSEAEAAERVARARSSVHSFLDGHWAAVAALAKTLRKQRALDGAQTTAIIECASRTGGRSALRPPLEDSIRASPAR